MELFTYFRSSAAYRVRIALNLKGMEAHPHFVHLVRDGGEQHRSDYRSLNPQALVPTLVDGEHAFTQSLAIIEYLEEVRPEPPLLPADTAERAWVRATAQLVACEIHPLNNLRVLQYLERELGVDPETRLKWYRHWVLEGFTALEARLQASPRRGRFCLGEAPTMADLCLVPQVYNARRFECDLEGFPEIRRIDAECLALDAFARAAPEAQPD
ncbi:MAG: maleylacetoacetate isomerase, partial [Gammaproteobacteria bacterium]